MTDDAWPGDAAAAVTSESLLAPLVHDRQVGYFAYCLRNLPLVYGKLDTNRLTLVHFAVHALDLLYANVNFWNNHALQQQLRLNKQAIVDWIYALQITTDQIQQAVQNDPSLLSSPPTSTSSLEALVGFKGGTFLGGSFHNHASEETVTSTTRTTTTALPWHYNHGHIAMTYTALCTLRTLGDDWSRLDKVGIIRALPHLQLDDGSFQCIAVGSEHDMRFLYCATAISYMLNDWSGIDMDKACQYIRRCKSFDGALALVPGQEGHGGSTFTGIASLVLMNRLEDVLDSNWRRELIHWCVARQVGGMQGRPNKAEDTCYSYWIGGTLRLLSQNGHDPFNYFSLLNQQALCDFVFECQTPMGGFGKLIQAPPDVLHSYYSLAYLSMAQEEFDADAARHNDDDGPDEIKDSASSHNKILKSLNCTLGIGTDVASFFQPKVP
ncbi:hypothetical protein ACA910_005657 [Epithemia clementina (nom. ined.)]